MKIIWDILACEFPDLNFDLIQEHARLRELHEFISESQKNIEYKVIRFLVECGQSLWNLNLLSTFYDELLSPSVEKTYIDKIKTDRFEGECDQISEPPPKPTPSFS